MGCGPRENGADRRVEIRVEDLHKSFGGRAVLCGVELEIRQGEIVAVVGGSGAGKTVLLDHMVGLLTPDRGRVLVADHGRRGRPLVDLGALDEAGLDRVRRHWAVVFQKNALFSGTVFQNIALWLKENTDLSATQIYDRVRDALDAVGFEGDDSILTKTRGELSGGMAKRVAVARAIAMSPAIIFYDEPTTGLDPQNAAKIHELICATHERARRENGGQTSVIITHDKDLLHRLRPRIVMLHLGRVFFDGAYEAFERSDSEIVRPYFELMPMLNQAPIPE
ncbi:MAG: ATP-binding cassette domain-containing protein [Planctomycetota bacterium]|nr:MAG: ATP-binding cassette domain-containing protein [Planctomycetota bacterium]